MAAAAIAPAVWFGAAPSHSDTGADAGQSAAIDRDFTVQGPSMQTATLSINRSATASVPIDPELKATLTEVSKDTGEPLDVLVARHAGEDLFDEMVDAFDAKYPGDIRFGGAATEGSGETARWLLLTNEPTADQIAILSTYPLPLEIRYGDGPTAQQMSDLAEKLQRELSTTDIVYGGFGFNDDKSGLKILFSASPAIGRGALETEAIAAIDRALGTADASGLPFTIDFTESVPLDAEEAITGGYSLWNHDNTARLCTTGFTVVRNGNLGVVTAKHCPQRLNYRSTSDTLADAIGATDAANGEIDLQFHRTLSPHVTTKRYQERAGDDVLVNTVEPIVQTDQGEIRYHTGWASGAYVYGFLSGDINVCRLVQWPNLSYHDECGLALTTHYVSEPGDSGGPWYTQAFQNASGIHTAGSASADSSAFTNISRVSINLDATVRTN